MREHRPRALQELAGHANLTTTQRNMHLSPAAKERPIRLMDQPIPGAGGGEDTSSCLVGEGSLSPRLELLTQFRYGSTQPRLTPTGEHHIMYEATIEDPEAFTSPWTIRMPLYRGWKRVSRFSTTTASTCSWRLLEP